MLGMRHVYHVSPFASTPYRSSPRYAHLLPSPWSYEGFRKPENEKSFYVAAVVKPSCIFFFCTFSNPDYSST